MHHFYHEMLLQSTNILLLDFKVQQHILLNCHQSQRLPHYDLEVFQSLQIFCHLCQRMSLLLLCLFKQLSRLLTKSCLSNHRDKILLNWTMVEFQIQSLSLFYCNELAQGNRSFKYYKMSQMLYTFNYFLFSMKKNLSTVTLSVSPLSVRGVNSPQHSKKVEGFDKVSSIQSFNTKIQKIKNQPKKESLEDMYVKGLQDQIHYLQLELKLLKEKQIAKHSQVDQLETFFGDGIPINQNILAMKNGFNNYKTTIEKKIYELVAEKKEREFVNESLAVKVSEMSKDIHNRQKKYKDGLTQISNITHEKVKMQALLKQQIETQDQNLRTLKTQNRKISQQIGNLQRGKQLILVSLLKNQNNKYTRLNKLKESISQKQKQFDQLGKKYQQLRKQQEQKSYVIKVQEDNLKYKKKIISLQKELNALHIKAQEKKMELDAKLKERHKQILARMDMQNRVDMTKESIDRQNSMSVEDLQRIAKQKQAVILQNIVAKNKKISKYLEYYSRLLSEIQDSLYAYGQKKPDLKREVQLYKNIVQNMQKQMQKEKNRQYESASQIAKLTSKSDHIKDIVPPTIDEIRKQQDKIKASKIQRQELMKQIKIKQKQLQLMQILKSLNLQEAQISNSSNSSIQDRLMDFMRNWELLKRNA